jgi:hypothetical protein
MITFHGLVSYLIASIIGMLKTDNAIFPNSLMVNSDKNIEVVRAAVETEKKLKSKASRFEIIASGIAYPDCENNQSITFLENNENYCVKVLVPVINQGGLKLNTEKIEIVVGAVYVLPVIQLH